MGFVTKLFSSIFGGGQTPQAQAAPVSGIPTAPPMAPSANAPTIADPGAAAGAELNRQRAAQSAGAGFSGTVTNSSGAQGISGTPTVASKTLLGA